MAPQGCWSLQTLPAARARGLPQVGTTAPGLGPGWGCLPGGGEAEPVLGAVAIVGMGFRDTPPPRQL